MATESKMICPKCFKRTYENGRCSSCHFDSTKAQYYEDALDYYTVLNDRYLVGLPLGQGGFGITYKCLDQQTRKLVVIKEYFPRYLHLTRDEMKNPPKDKKSRYHHGLDSFKKEAVLLCAMRDRHYRYIVSAKDYFEQNGTCYYVMDYIEGASLRSLVGKYPFTVKELTDLVIKIGRELGRLHREEDLLHRDISPENILVTASMQPILIDFGSAKFINSEDQEQTITLKKHFAPIEQYSRDKAQGAYTDVYLLAATYYFLLTGKYVPNANDRLIKHQTYPSLIQCGVPVSKSVSDAVDRALAVTIEKRTPTMEKFVEGIQSAGSAHVHMTQREKTVVYTTTITPGTPLIRFTYRHHQHLVLMDEKSPIQIGRALQNDICLPFKQVTSNHLTVYFDGRQQLFRVTDHSKNGAFVNRKFINNQSITVKPGVSIRLPGVDDALMLEVANV